MKTVTTSENSLQHSSGLILGSQVVHEKRVGDDPHEENRRERPENALKSRIHSLERSLPAGSYLPIGNGFFVGCETFHFSTTFMDDFLLLPTQLFAVEIDRRSVTLRVVLSGHVSHD